MTAAMALAARRHGLDVLVLEVEGRGELAQLLEGPPLGFAATELIPADPATGKGAVNGRSLVAEEALTEYLHERGFGRLAKLLTDTGVVDVITRGAPGMKDILLLGKIKQLERDAAAAVILVDAPASGHAVTFLKSPRGLLDAVEMGAIHTQATEVLELLTDENRCEVLLATLAEETPVNELIETAYSLEEEVGIKLGPVLVNAVYPSCALPADPGAATAGLPAALADSLGRAADFRARRSALQGREIARLAATLPLAQIVVPFQFAERLGRAELESVADAIEAAVLRLPGRPD